jgi:hypothetical protein
MPGCFYISKVWFACEAMTGINGSTVTHVVSTSLAAKLSFKGAGLKKEAKVEVCRDYSTFASSEGCLRN